MLGIGEEFEFGEPLTCSGNFGLESHENPGVLTYGTYVFHKTDWIIIHLFHDPQWAINS